MRIGTPRSEFLIDHRREEALARVQVRRYENFLGILHPARRSDKADAARCHTVCRWTRIERPPFLLRGQESCMGLCGREPEQVRKQAHAEGGKGH